MRPETAQPPPGDDPRRLHREFPFTCDDFERVRSMILERAGISLAPSKRDMAYSRLVRRVRSLGFPSFSAYLDAVERGKPSGEAESFTNALTTNLTSFFREPHHFELFRAHLVGQSARPLRIWCCGASTGEEAWSIAISACEAFGSLRPPVEILASDIDTAVLESARTGIYRLERIESIAGPRRRSFFLRGTGPNSGLCRLRPELHALLRFSPINLLGAWPAEARAFDVIFCRNVMIYFDPPTQRAVLGRLMQRLADDGLLFAGHSESFVHALDLVRPVGRTVYRHPDSAQ